MLTDRPEFRAWLSRHDAYHFARQGFREDPSPMQDGYCDCCGGPVAGTPSRAGVECLPCLAERFGGDQVEKDVVKVLLGGMIRAAMKSDEIADDLVIRTQSASTSETGLSSGQGLERERWQKVVA